jgi:hypothetical protein
MFLSTDENVVYSTRFSKRIFVKPVIASVLVVVLAFIFRSIAPEIDRIEPRTSRRLR